VKILFICSNLIGDTILSSGVLKHLINLHKEAKITLVIGPTAAPLFKNYKNVEKVIIFKKKKFNLHWFNIFAKIYSIQWDIVVDFRSSILTYFLKHKTKYIFKKKIGMHHIDQLNQSFGFLCSNLFIPTSFEEENKSNSFIEKSFKHIIVFPGGNWKPKIWSVENYNAVMEYISRKHEKIKFILVGSKIEKDKYYDKLVKGIDKKLIIDLFGFNLTLTSAFMKKSDLFIGNDSGLMHLAVSSQVKVIALFGPTDDKTYAPYGNANIVIRTDESVDYFKSINIDKNKSYMKSIKVDTVIETIERLLK